MTMTVSRLACALLLVACTDTGGTTTEADSGSTGEAASTTDASTQTTSDGATTQLPTTSESTDTTSGPQTSTSTSTSTGTTDAPADEQLTLLDGPCEKSPGAATRCERHEVTCEGLAPAVVELATYAAKGGVAVEGDRSCSAAAATALASTTSPRPRRCIDASATQSSIGGGPTGGLAARPTARSRPHAGSRALIRHLRSQPPRERPAVRHREFGRQRRTRLSP
jgi:hypothetical protein